MNRVVHAHIKSIMPESPHPDDPVFLGGGARPNDRFQQLCSLAGIEPRKNAETANAEPWPLKDLRNTCATYYDQHVPESLIEILGHSVESITYRHYAHRAPLAFDYDPAAADRAFRPPKGIRWRMPVLPKAIRRRVVVAGDVSDRPER